jgi:bile acid:Na+ symporter, BASS family
MDLKQIIILVLQLSIMATVFGFGLRSTPNDLLYLIRRPGLFVRSLLAVFVVMPIVAFALDSLFEFRRTVEVALVALSVSPVPPLLPKQGSKAGGEAAYGVGLMAWLALSSIVAIPISLTLLGFLAGRQFSMPPGLIVNVVVKSVLAPLLAGMLVRAFLPGIANRIEKPVRIFGNVLLPLGALILFAGAASPVWALIGNGTVFALLTFVVAGLAIGHLLGGPNPHHAGVLGLATASRHPAIALAIAARNFPDEHFGATILLYLIVNALVGVPYLIWQRQQLVTAIREVAP